MPTKQNPTTKSRRTLGQRRRIFSQTVGRRSKRRIHYRSRWPVVYTDILLLASIGAALSFWLIDNWALTARQYLPPATVDFFKAVTDIGKAEWILIPTGLICLLLVFVDWQGLSRRQQVWLSGILFDAWFAFVAVAGSGLLVNLIKQLAGRARPRHLETLGPAFFDPFRFDYSFASFPSGHSTTIAAIATVLALRFPKFMPVFAMLALIIGVSRVFVGAHYPSDVIMGLATGLLFSLVLARAFALKHMGFRFADNGATDSALPLRRVLRGSSPLGPSGVLNLAKRLSGFSR